MPKHRIEVKSLEDLENRLGYQFKNKDLLRQSVTHQSAISEKHPLAAAHDQSSLAFLGDAALKHAVARYLILNGEQEVTKSGGALHNGTQTVIPNSILADIAREKLHLEKYIIRGNNHQDVSTKMYADCFEAILGAIDLDCGPNQEKILFSVIEKLCSDRYEHLLKPIDSIRFLSGGPDEDNDEELVIITQTMWIILQSYANPSLSRPKEILVMEREKTRREKYFFVVLCFLAICGIYFILRIVVLFLMSESSISNETRRNEFL